MPSFHGGPSDRKGYHHGNLKEALVEAARRFIALEVWALSHGIATLDAAGQLPKGPGLPDKYELLRAGVLALVHGAHSGAK